LTRTKPGGAVNDRSSLKVNKFSLCEQMILKGFGQLILQLLLLNIVVTKGIKIQFSVKYRNSSKNNKILEGLKKNMMIK
jgi:hypothetical protein